MRVDKIIRTQPDVFQGLSKTWFTTTHEGKPETAYMFHKPENTPTAGEEYEGSLGLDKGGYLKFSKAKKDYPPKDGGSPAPTPKVFKADPDKMKQDLVLDVARNQSIQRQVAVKAAVDLVMADIVPYEDLNTTYAGIMELLSEPDWKKFRDLEITDSEGNEIETDLDGTEIEWGGDDEDTMPWLRKK